MCFYFSIFHVFQCFSPYSSSYSVCVSFSTFQFSRHNQVLECGFFFSFFMFLSVSLHIPGPTVCISHFPRFSVFLLTFQVIQCLCLIFNVFQFSFHIPGTTVCIFHFPRFSVFLPILQVLKCTFLIFHVFQFSLQNPGPTVCLSNFSRFFIVSTHIHGLTVCVSHFFIFSGFL